MKTRVKQAILLLGPVLFIIWSMKKFKYGLLSKLWNVQLTGEMQHNFLRLNGIDHTTKIVLIYTNLYNLNLQKGYEIFSQCPLKNCYLTYNKNIRNKADMIIFNAFHVSSYPPLLHKPKNQKWLFYLIESPYHIWRNFSMMGNMDYISTYTSDSDIVSPYGAYVPLDDRTHIIIEPTNFHSKSRLVAIIVSHCETPNNRELLIFQLSLFIPIHVYGNCEKKWRKKFEYDEVKSKIVFHTFPRIIARNNDTFLPNNMTIDSSNFDSENDENGDKICAYKEKEFENEKCLRYLGKNYKFYLSFENSACKEYITEKFWYNALSFNMLPVVYGPFRYEYREIGPPNSFIHAVEDSEGNVKMLADIIIKVGSSKARYNRYFEWKKFGKVENYMMKGPTNQNPMWCTICQKIMAFNEKLKLNKTDDQKNSMAHKRFDWWWHPESMCILT
ncbi:unnamed protein product [Gordionus sp. m RMFG-2023]